MKLNPQPLSPGAEQLLREAPFCVDIDGTPSADRGELVRANLARYERVSPFDGEPYTEFTRTFAGQALLDTLDDRLERARGEDSQCVTLAGAVGVEATRVYVGGRPVEAEVLRSLGLNPGEVLAASATERYVGEVEITIRSIRPAAPTEGDS